MGSSEAILEERRSPLRILCVDDEPDIRALTAMGLRLAPDMDVKDDGSGDGALNLIRNEPWRPDLFLLDVMMPDISGTALLTLLRGIEDIADTPVIFMTARTSLSALQEYRTCGAFGVIAKPFNVLNIASQVRTLLTNGQFTLIEAGQNAQES